MPGIVGLITSMPRELAEPQLLRMLAAIRHESSYSTGTWIDESIGIYLGWAVRQGSFCDGMPLLNEGRDVVLVLSGEEYPEPDTASRLRTQGHCLDSDDAAYLVHLYESDLSFPVPLNGRFQGVVIDQRLGRAILFNDRSGMHRVYYHESQDAFYFAAEAKAILAVRPELGQIDPRGLGEYVTCGCVLENRTLFPAIHVLPPASAWTFRNGWVEQRQTYFDPSAWERQSRLEPEAYYETLRGVFVRNLPRYFTARERIAMSLTGGLDTRMIMAWWNAPAGSFPCYSFGGSYRDSQDVLLARRLAGICRQPYTEIRVGADFCSRFPGYAERTVFLTDGCADVSFSPVLYVNEQVRCLAPIRMTGNYGGEVLRGHRAFKPVEPLPGLFCADLAPHVSQARHTYEGLTRSHPVTFAVFHQAPWHHHGLFTLEQTQLSVRSPYLDNDLVRTAYRAPQPAVRHEDTCLRLIGDGDGSLRKVRTDRGVGKTGALAAASRRVLEFSVKAEYAYDYGMPQWLARLDHALSAFQLERLFLGRHKYYHFRVWYRDALADYVREMLLDPRTLGRPFINRETVERIVAAHTKGVGNYTSAIHRLLTLELLHRTLLDRPQRLETDRCFPCTSASAYARIDVPRG